jgi:ubiquinone/menaquinone biosynthesis C-methylase UbiE
MPSDSRPSLPPVRPFIPAAGRDFLLPLYDPLTSLLGGNRVRARLLHALELSAGDRVLDLGAGTGALSIALKRRHPQAVVVGIDPDPKALARARAKAERAGLDVDFHEAYGDALPFEGASFQHVVSSLVLHHLTSDAKAAVLREAHRVLAPGGTLRILDFGPPRSRVQRALGKLFHSHDELADNLTGRIPDLIQAAGFSGAREGGWWGTLFGTVAVWAGEKPG